VSEITQILGAMERGDVRAVDELFPLVYKELCQLAAQRLRKEPVGQTLQATALVHEAYLRLIGSENQHWYGRHHFFSAAAEAMRRILVENARRKQSLKRGGDRKQIELDEAVLMKDDGVPADDIIALDEALEKLSKKDKIKADLVKLRYFAGLTIEQAAEILDISPTTAKRYWAYARAWLLREVG